MLFRSAVQLDGAGSGAAVLDVFTDLQISDSLTLNGPVLRSEERRVGKECRSRWSPSH